MMISRRESSSSQASASSCSSSSSTRSVRFAKAARARLSMHLHEYTEDEKQAAFYNANDFRIFRLDAKRGAEMMESDTADENDFFCTRGLEQRTTEGLKQRLRNKCQSISAVLTQQFLEREEGLEMYAGSDTIASVYAKAAQHCSVSAYMTGLSDAKAVQEQQQEKEPSDCEEQSKSIHQERQSPGRALIFGFAKNSILLRRQLRSSAA